MEFEDSGRYKQIVLLLMGRSIGNYRDPGGEMK